MELAHHKTRTTSHGFLLTLGFAFIYGSVSFPSHSIQWLRFLLHCTTIGFVGVSSPNQLAVIWWKYFIFYGGNVFTNWNLASFCMLHSFHNQFKDQSSVFQNHPKDHDTHRRSERLMVGFVCKTYCYSNQLKTHYRYLLHIARYLDNIFSGKKGLISPKIWIWHGNFKPSKFGKQFSSSKNTTILESLRLSLSRFHRPAEWQVDGWSRQRYKDFHVHDCLLEIASFDVYFISNQILFVQPEITIYTLSHWVLTNCTDVASSVFRPSNQVRKI